MGDVFSFLHGIGDDVLDFIRDIPIFGPTLAFAFEVPVRAVLGDLPGLTQSLAQLAPFAAQISGFPLLGFLPGEEGISVPVEPLSSPEFIRGILELAGQAARLSGVVDVSVGTRLASLASTHGDLLKGVLDTFFPEFSKIAGPLGDVLRKQFPELGGLLGQSGRYSGVRRDTVRLAAKKKWVPPEWAAQRGIHNPEGEESLFQDVTGFEGYDPLAGAPEFGTMIWGQLGETLSEPIWALGSGIVKSLMELLEPLLVTGVEAGKRVGSLVADTAAASFGAIGETMLRAVEDRLTMFGEIGPGQQRPVVREALGDALLLGTGAHLTAAAAELLMPLKHLGLPQIAAFMVDLAGFGTVASASHGPLIRAGIQLPATWAAQERFRSNLPALRDAKQFVLERLITLDDYAQILRWNGYPEEWVRIYLEEVWEEPSLRELSTVVDDTPVDEDWLRVKVRETGLSDDDVELFLSGLQRRANKSIRVGYTSALQVAFREGLLDEAELEGELERLNLNAEARDLLRRRSALEKRRELAELWERAWRDLALDQVVDLDDYRLALRGLGYQEDRVEVLVATVEAKLTGRVARDERADLKAVVRGEQRLRVQLAQEAFRRRQIDAGDLEAILTGLGIEAQQARAFVALEEVRRQPVPRVPVPLTPEAQREVENEVIQEAALVAFREGKIDEAALTRVLRSLGLTDRLVEALVTLELARKDKPKPVVVKEDPAVVRARQIKTEAAITEFRQGKVVLEQLRFRLRDAGWPDVVVAAFLEREVARLPSAS